jgi:phosphonopyruvate decarboxylase
MINTKLFFEYLIFNNVSFYCGVPDSLLKDFCAFVSDNTSQKNHIIAANEGSAIALATGYHLATKKIPLVYLQNSGLGNTINPLLSLADPEVYGVPMILLIGWRGEPGFKDEPQHIKQGRIQNRLLESLEIPYYILGSENSSNYEQILEKVINEAETKSMPIAIVVKAGTFEEYKLKKQKKSTNLISREEAISIILDNLSEESIVVSTTGKASREVYEIREKQQKNCQKDFLTVGSMGHANNIALGIALFNDNKVICLDGDGALIMHMGSLAINGTISVNNFVHIVLNNEAHESVGGQPTVAGIIDFCQIASACGYDYVKKVDTKESLISEILNIKNLKTKAFLEVKVNLSSRKDLSRPKSTPKESKESFMKKIINEN